MGYLHGVSIILLRKCFNKKDSPWELARRGKSWDLLILFMCRALSFPAFPENGLYMYFTSFQVTLRKRPKIYTMKKICSGWSKGRGSRVQLFGFPWHPNWPPLTCLQGIPGPLEGNVKPLCGSGGLRDVGMLSIFVGSGRGNPAKISLVTPEAWRHYVPTEAVLPHCTGL